ncbi:Glycosyl transferase family 2 [anaerobic digester metagenome]
MCKISVVMSAYNVEKYVSESIESVLKQSFSDFEFIIVNDGSTDDTLSIIRSFKDERIKLIENKHDFIESLNLGMKAATGKYIARMDADDIMHIDRLRIEQAILEENPDITVCTSWISPFGEGIPKGTINRTISGIVKSPLLHLLRNNLFFNPTSIMRSDFIRKNKLKYEYYDFAEDYKWWVEMAKAGAIFYIEPQSLLYYRISESQVTNRFKYKMTETSIRIKKEIIDFLIASNNNLFTELSETLTVFYKLKTNNLLSEEDIIRFFHVLFTKNEIFLTTDDYRYK